MKNSKLRTRRSGAAVVEMALCLPVLVLMTWGTIETSSSIFQRQTLTSAAHEGVLTGMRRGSTETEIRNRIDVILQSRQLDNSVVEITPSGAAFDQLLSGEPFSITITRQRTNQIINLAAVSVTLTTQRP